MMKKYRFGQKRGSKSLIIINSLKANILKQANIRNQ